MARRQERKRQTRKRIVEAAAARMRREGLGGAAVAEVMQDAGLTHGGFYAHFTDKTELAAEALQRGVEDGRADWFRGLDGLDGEELLRWLAGRYLNAWHRDTPAEGCAFAAMAPEAARADGPLRETMSRELQRSIAAIAEGLAREGARDGNAAHDEAVAFLALCMGGIQIARAVTDPAQSERILRACRLAAQRLAAGAPQDEEIHEGEDVS